MQTVIDAAEDVQIACRAQRQRADFAGTVDAGLGSLRIQTRIAEARQIEIALHHHVATRIGDRVADDFHTGTQMQGIRVSGVVETGQFAGQQIVVGQRTVDEVVAVLVFFFQVILI